MTWARETTRLSVFEGRLSGLNEYATHNVWVICDACLGCNRNLAVFTRGVRDVFLGLCYVRCESSNSILPAAAVAITLSTLRRV